MKKHLLALFIAAGILEVKAQRAAVLFEKALPAMSKKTMIQLYCFSVKFIKSKKVMML